jgi:hypothetical protein
MIDHRGDGMMDAPVQSRAAGVLSHVEAVYPPGDRELAIELFEALGCKTYDTQTMSPSGSTYVSVHPDPEDRNLDNVIYLSEMPSEQRGLEEALRQRLEVDGALREARDRFRRMVHERPYGLSHIAVRYPSFEALERVLDGVEQRMSPALRARVTLRVFRPGDSADIVWNSVQAFVCTDLAVSGSALFGQVWELSAYGPFA